MAILTAIFSALSKKVGDLLQAVFGWSIVSMFGKLTSREQILISGALVLSLFWPVFVVGVFVPSAAAFIVAFVPFKDSISPNVLRVVWIALAVVSPIIVGLLTRVVSPQLKSKGFLAAVINGYPLALGFAFSFLITLVVVPIVRLSSMIKGLSDEHVFIQTRQGHYFVALRELGEACALGELQPQAAPVPFSMGLATRVLHFFARGAIDSLVVQTPLMIKAKGLDLFLYPGDLLLRGKKETATRVRALLTQTHLDQHAYFVQTERAQELQDDLLRLRDVIEKHPNRSEIGDNARDRLAGIVKATAKAQLAFDEWLMLDGMTRRLESQLSGERTLVDAATLGLPWKAENQEQDMNASKTSEKPVVAATPKEPTVLELVERGMGEAKQLIAFEVALAKEEATQQMKQAVGASVGFVLALAFTSVALALLGVALVLYLGGTVAIAAGVAGGFAALGAVGAGVGYSLLPKKPLGKAIKHVEGDIKQLQEHIA